MDDFSLGEGVDPAFFYSARYDHTYLALKLAVSKDDKIAETVGVRTFLTGEQANTEVHRIRSGFDGIVVGANTLRADDPFSLSGSCLMNQECLLPALSLALMEIYALNRIFLDLLVDLQF